MAAWQEILSSVFISYSVAPLETISQGAQFADTLLDLNTNTESKWKGEREKAREREWKRVSHEMAEMNMLST